MNKRVGIALLLMAVAIGFWIWTADSRVGFFESGSGHDLRRDKGSVVATNAGERTLVNAAVPLGGEVLSGYSVRILFSGSELPAVGAKVSVAPSLERVFDPTGDLGLQVVDSQRVDGDSPLFFPWSSRETDPPRLIVEFAGTRRIRALQKLGSELKRIDVVLKVPELAALQVSVKARGVARPNAVLSLKESQGASAAIQQVSDSAGRADFREVAAGEWQLSVSDAEYGERSLEVLSLSPGEMRPFEIELDQGSSIEVRLFDRFGGVVHGPFRASIRRIEGGRNATKSAGEGSCRFRGFPSGAVIVSIGLDQRLAASSGTELSFQAKQLEIVPGENLIEFHALPLVEHFYGVITLGNRPVRSGGIRAFLPNGATLSADIENGNYEFFDIPATRIQLQLEIEGRYWPADRTIDLSNQGTSIRHDLDLPNGQLHLIVRNEVSGEIVRGCAIQVSGSQGRPLSTMPGFPYSTDLNGEWILSGLPVEDLMVCVGPGLSASEQNASLATVQVTVTAEAVASGSPIQVVLPKGSTLELNLIDANGAAVQGGSAFVFLESGESLGRVAALASDQLGRIKLFGVPSSGVKVVVRHRDYAPSVLFFPGPLGNAVDQTKVILEQGAAVRFTSRGTIPEGARLEVFGRDSGLDLRGVLADEMPFGSSVTFGHFLGNEVMRLYPGEYRARLVAPSGLGDWYDFRVDLAAAERSVFIEFRGP
jgi:hypothetical protein